VNSLNNWHARIGLIVICFVFLLSITGILLNHSAGLNLDNRPIPNWLAKTAYGYQVPKKSIEIAGLRISQQQTSVHVNGRMLASCEHLLLDAVLVEDMIAIICRKDIALVSMDGELIELLSASLTLPELIQGFILLPQQRPSLLLRFTSSIAYLDVDNMQLQPVDSSSGLSDTLLAKPVTFMEDNSQRIDLSWERFLLDLHSGRVFGVMGVMLMDLAAIGLMLLSVTGFWLWQRKRRLLRELEADDD